MLAFASREGGLLDSCAQTDARPARAEDDFAMFFREEVRGATRSAAAQRTPSEELILDHFPKPVLCEKKLRLSFSNGTLSPAFRKYENLKR